MQFFLSLLLYVFSSNVFSSNIFAYRLTCPPVELIKTAKFMHAFNNPNDHDVWDFSSQTFTYKAREWNVSFGTFLPKISTEAQALQRGQAYFDKQNLPILHPKPFHLPSRIIFCDYVPPGNLFWVAALNPPQYEGSKK